jgi:PKD repeat protein/Leucine-rich repeat (LRR) protein
MLLLKLKHPTRIARLFALALFVLTVAGTASAQVPATERAALIDLYNSTGGAAWSNSSGWLGVVGTECSWYGVSCSYDEYFYEYSVTSLELANNNLSGSIPDLSALTQLYQLDLESNNLSGSIPDLSALTQLQYLSLSNNNLSGSIPDLSALTQLQSLHLPYNSLSGSIPDLSALTQLVTLRLHFNSLSGSIPDLSALTQLQLLHLHVNSISGSIPDLSALTQLQSLYLAINNLTGSIPDLSALSQLQILESFNNSLSGSIPDLSALAQLQSLDLWGNSLSGSIPDLSALTQLQSLDLSFNNLSGSIPDLSALTQLQALDLPYNSLSGSIPDLSALTQLEYLNLSFNYLSGPFPAMPPGLRQLNISGNAFVEVIPDFSGASLFDLDVGFNGFTSSNPGAAAFASSVDSDWEDTQTVPPAGVSAAPMSSSQIQVSWTPILYTQDSGRYRVRYGTTPGGPYPLFAETSGKTASGLVLLELQPDQTYYMVVESESDPNASNSNLLTSLVSEEVSTTTQSSSGSPPPARLSFSQESYEVNEVDGVVRLVIQWDGMWQECGYSDYVSDIYLSVVEGSATVDDIGPIPTGPFSILQLPEATLEIEIPIAVDGIPEGGETLTLSFDSEFMRGPYTSLECYDGDTYFTQESELGLTTTTVVIHDSEALEAAFEAQPGVAFVEEEVRFADRSTGEIDSWSWSFGDGADSTARNPVHTYDTPGTYVVTLTVSGPGGSDSETSSVEVVPAVEQGPEETLASADTAPEDPVVVYDALGRKAVAWEAEDGSAFGVFAELFEPDGSSSTGTFRVNAEVSGNQTQPAAVLDSEGRLTVVWVEEGDGAAAFPGGREASSAVSSATSIVARRFDKNGLPDGAAQVISTQPEALPSNPRASVDGEGGVTILWEEGERIRGRLRDRDGNLETPVLDVDAGEGGVAPDVGRSANGEFVAVWRVRRPTGQLGRQGHPAVARPAPTVLGRLFDKNGLPRGAPFPISEAPSAERPVAGSTDDGGFVVAWDAEGEDDREVFARRFDRHGSPAGPELRVNGRVEGAQTRPRLDTSSAGAFVVVWENERPGTAGAATVTSGQSVLGRFFDPSGKPQSGDVVVAAEDGETVPSEPDVSIDDRGETTAVFNRRERDGKPRGIRSRIISPAIESESCATGSQELCLQGSRFRLRLEFETNDGSAGLGTANLLTSDTGFFTFFDESNVEVVIKVLDACAINNRFWVFASGLTDVATSLYVEDTATGGLRTYHNAQGEPFEPILDTDAFATCAAGSAGRPGHRLMAMAGTSRAASLEVDSATVSGAACQASATQLCLNGNRFAVQATWTNGPSAGNPSGGAGQAEPLTADTGYFWFFDDANVELVVKVLDACTLSGSHWVFAAGLTDREVELTVTDTATGQLVVYRSVFGSAFELIRDIGSFRGCQP